MSRRWLCMLVVATAGCGPTPAPPKHSGAETVVRDYYEALLRQDWTQAYASLHPDSRTKFSADEFARLARTYRSQLGFKPQSVKVRSCEEHGDEAIAHVIITGQSAPKRRKDAVTLRRGQAGWAIVLPPRFGQSAVRPR
jgi:hypothetical protein